MTIDSTFWVAVSFFIFLGGLIYLKVPQKVNDSLIDQINQIKKELEEAEKLKVEAKNLLSDYESKIDKSKKETKEIINLANKDSEKNILEKTKKFHQMMENRKKNIEFKIIQMKNNALNEIKNLKQSSISNISKIAIETSEEIINKIIGTEVNKSNVSAIVDEVIKRKGEKLI